MGKLAKELDFVSHHVRTQLDELKRQEVSRLRTLIKAKQDIEGGNGMLPSERPLICLSAILLTSRNTRACGQMTKKYIFEAKVSRGCGYCSVSVESPTYL